MLKLYFVFAPLIFILLLLLESCSQSAEVKSPIIDLKEPVDGFKIEIGKSLPLQPIILNGSQSTYAWTVNGTIVCSSQVFTFTPSRIGEYNLQFKVTNQSGSDTKSISVKAFSSFSPYISKIFDYQYAPGQHASLIPSDLKGADFIGQPWTGSKIYTSLGGWGGYIVAGFDHSVVNNEGADFAVYTQPGAGSEPGIVYVMADTNNDGLPNDGDWLEIKGSEYNNPETIHNYQVTYYKPVGSGNVKWSDNKGRSGELIPAFNSSSWWWEGYGNKNQVTFSGSRLPDAYINNSTQPDVENWLVKPGLFTSGYAECYYDLDYNSYLKANLFDISSAIDQSGNKVNLSHINFIKVQSGVFQIAGWLNEISTEVSGAADLSLIEYVQN